MLTFLGLFHYYDKGTRRIINQSGVPNQFIWLHFNKFYINKGRLKYINHIFTIVCHTIKILLAG